MPDLSRSVFRRPVCVGFHRTPYLTVWYWDWEEF